MGQQEKYKRNGKEGDCILHFTKQRDMRHESIVQGPTLYIVYNMCQKSMFYSSKHR